MSVTLKDAPSNSFDKQIFWLKRICMCDDLKKCPIMDLYERSAAHHCVHVSCVFTAADVTCICARRGLQNCIMTV